MDSMFQNYLHNKKLDKLFFYTIFQLNKSKPKGKNMVKKAKNSKKTSVSKRIWAAICWPFKKVWAGLRWFWNWIASVNVAALLNIALLVSIIVLFTLLIIDLRKGAKASDSYMLSQNVTTVASGATEQPKINIRKIKPRKSTTLPVKRSVVTRKLASRPIQVAKIQQNPVAINQVAIVSQRTQKTVQTIIMGDTVIDNHDMTKVLTNNARVKGNLYIQDLRKYTLPCNVVIEGNLILRDVNMVNFCGDFTVCGNIYVSPRSSFAPLPRTARIGGRVIL